MSECTKCAAIDLAVRRSLLVVRNHLAPIEPSLEFTLRLSARLERERQNPAISAPLFGSTTWAGFATMCGAVLMIGVLAVSLGDDRGGPGIARLPAVVFAPTVSALEAAEFISAATPSFVATVSTGMAILPALLLAEELPVRGARPTVRRTGLTVPVPESR